MTQCRAEWDGAKFQLLDALRGSYFTRRAVNPAMRADQRQRAKEDLGAVMARLTAVLGRPEARFALPRGEVRAFGRVVAALASLLDGMGVKGARAVARSQCKLLPSLREVEAELAELRATGDDLRLVAGATPADLCGRPSLGRRWGRAPRR